MGHPQAEPQLVESSADGVEQLQPPKPHLVTPIPHPALVGAIAVCSPAANGSTTTPALDAFRLAISSPSFKSYRIFFGQDGLKGHVDSAFSSNALTSLLPHGRKLDPATAWLFHDFAG
jgi:hypothetical protein